MSNESRLHALKNLPGYLHSGGDEARLRILLGSYSFLDRKVASLSTSELVSDYEYLPEDSSLRLVQAAVRMSAHILDRDPGQLPAHLLGRLLDRSEQAEVADLLESARKRMSRELVPTVASMTRPGGALLQTYSVTPRTNGGIYSVILALDGEHLVAGSSDRTIRIWNLVTGREIRAFRGHGKAVVAVKLTPDGRRVVSGSWDRTVRIWNLATGIQEAEIPMAASVQAVAVAPDGEQIAAGLEDGSIEVVDLTTGAARRFSGHEKKIRGLAITPDGRRLISGSDDGSLRIWNLSKGDVERVESMAVWSLVTTPESCRIIFSLENGSLGIFNLVDGSTTRIFEGHHGHSLALAPDGRTLVSEYDGKLMVCDLVTMQVQGFVSAPRAFLSLALNSDGSRAVIGDHTNRVHLWDLSTIQTEETPAYSSRSVQALALVPGGQLLLSGAFDQTIKVWDIGLGREIRRLTGHAKAVKAVAATPDGRYAISGSSDQTVKIWDLSTGECLRTLTGHNSQVIALSITEDGRFVVSGGIWAEVKVWSLEDGREIFSRRRASGYLTALATTSDGCLAVAAFQDDANVWPVIFNLATGHVVGELRGHDGPVDAALILPGDHRILTGSYDATIRMWDFASRRELLRLEGHADRILCLAATPDGRHVVSGSDDNTVRVWRLDTGECLAIFNAEEGITACAISPDARLVIAAEGSGSIHFLELRNGGASRHVLRPQRGSSGLPQY